jgi:hypothetical protein
VEAVLAAIERELDQTIRSLKALVEGEAQIAAGGGAVAD